MIEIKKAERDDCKDLLKLIDALADYEKLDPPDKEARERLVEDGFGDSPKYESFLAYKDGRAIGYAIFYLTYSSFLAKPTLYLEDIFVLKEYRREGAGKALFSRCVEESRKRACSRVDFVVLKWNTNAQRFYEKEGAKVMDDWLLYRLEQI